MKAIFLKFLNSRWPLLLILLLTLITSINWFDTGKLIVTGEDGLWMYDYGRTLSLYSSYWSPKFLGSMSLLTVPRIPLYTVLTMLSSFLPNWQVQFLFYLILLFGGVCGMYLLSGLFIKSKDSKMIAAIFYIGNTFVLSQVFDRFILSYFVVWATLPVFLYYSFLLIGQYKHRIFIKWIIACALCFAAFASPGLIFVYWIPLGLYSAWKFYDSKWSVKVIYRFILLIVSCLLLNIWWIYPLLTIGSVGLSGASIDNSNIEIAKSLSQYYPLNEIIFLKQTHIFNSSGTIYEIYNQKYMIATAILILAIQTYGLFKFKKGKMFLIILLFFGLLLAKGTNPPFGHVLYSFLFEYFPQTAVLRNSYEKLGLLVVLPLSLFYALGVSELSISRKHKPIYLLFGILPILYTLPIFTGDLFNGNRVKVPTEYEMNDINLSNDGRIISMPLIDGDGITYTWGYSGIEPSEYLFDIPTVSKISRTNSNFDDLYSSLYNEMFVGNYEVVDEYMHKLRIRYAIYHKDIASGGVNESIVKNTATYLEDKKLIASNDYFELYEIGENTSIVSIDNRKVDYTRQGNRMIDVSLNGQQDEISLDFWETYSDNWLLEGGKIEEHTVAGDYGNKWKVVVTDGCCKLTFKVWPWE